MPSKHLLHLVAESKTQIRDAHRKAKKRGVSLSELVRGFLHALPMEPGDARPETIQLWL